MEELRDLREMGINAVAQFDSYSGEDFVLPQIFKDRVKEINSNKITYNKYSAIIKTAGNQNGTLNIYMPNQWFYIASFFTEYYNELLNYKKTALTIFSKDRLKILNGNQLTENENREINSLQLNEASKSHLVRFITDYEWWGGAKTIDRGDFYVSPILSLAKLVNASQSFVADLCAFLADKQELVRAIINGEETLPVVLDARDLKIPFQQIFYGAPGTGKSHTIHKMTNEKDVIRTTFHPDSDYSTFVGAYKPTTLEKTVMTVIGTKAVQVEDREGNEYKESQIVYEFVSQSFLQAYIAAWKKYADNGGNEPKKQYLIIEEINRGNCAQVFGDLFQLLDRNNFGFSEYPIKTDADMKKQLNKVFKGLDILHKDRINAMFDGRDIVKEVLEGEQLLLPNNLYIWATMNTSDQSLFPIDSAFKRRWDWTYIPISNAHKDWTIKVGGNSYDWWQFLERINDLIATTTNSEDKKLGYFFCKAKDKVISADTFVGKVIFYLWNDVFKDYDFYNQVFNDVDGNKLTFNKFYTTEGRESKVIEERVEHFFNNLGVKPIEMEAIENEPSYLEDKEEQNSRDKTRYSINGEGNYPKKLLAKELIERFVKLHPEYSAEKVIELWKPFSNVLHFVENSIEYEQRTEDWKKRRTQAVTCNDGTTVWVSTHGWILETINDLIDRVNSSEWNLQIKTIE